MIMIDFHFKSWKKKGAISTWFFLLKYYEPKIKGNLKLKTFPPIPLEEKNPYAYFLMDYDIERCLDYKVHSLHVTYWLF